MTLKNFIPYLLLFIASSIICLGYNQSPIYNYYSDDSSVYQYIASLILEGFTPYIDIFDHKGPIVHLYHTLGYAFSPLNGQYYIEIISVFISMIFAYKTSILYLPKSTSTLLIIALYSTIHSVDTFGNTEIQAFPCLFYIIYQFNISIKNNYISSKSSFLLGVSTALISLIKLNYLIYPFITFLSLFIFLIYQKQYNIIKKFFIYGCLGFFTTLLPVLLWLYLKNAITHFYDDYILFNLSYASKNSTPEQFRESYDIFTNFLIIKVMLLLGIFSLFLIRLYNRKELFILLISIILFYTTFLSLVATGNTYAHYILLLYPSILTILIYILKPIKYQKLVFVTILLISPIFIKNSLDHSALHHKVQKLKTGKIKQISSYLENYLAPNETFLYLGNYHTIIYLYSKRKASNIYAYNYMLKDIIPHKFYQTIADFPPNLIVTHTEYIPQYYIDYSKYQQIYYDGYFIVYALPSFISTKNRQFVNNNPLN